MELTDGINRSKHQMESTDQNTRWNQLMETTMADMKYDDAQRWHNTKDAGCKRLIIEMKMTAWPDSMDGGSCSDLVWVQEGVGREAQHSRTWKQLENSETWRWKKKTKEIIDQQQDWLCLLSPEFGKLRAQSSQTHIRYVGEAAHAIDLKIIVEDHALHLFEFLRWKQGAPALTNTEEENLRMWHLNDDGSSWRKLTCKTELDGVHRVLE
jgi:hypothetical protein